MIFFIYFVGDWNQTYKNNTKYDILEIVFDCRKLFAQKISYQNKRPYSQNTTNNIVDNKSTIIHANYTSECRHNSPNDRHKSSSYNSKSAIFVIKMFGHD